MSLLLARVLRLASVVICLIVTASFLTFAVQQTKTASKGQQEELVGSPTPAPSTATTPAAKGSTSTPRKGAVHKALDEASDWLTSPFAGVVSSSSSEWVIHGVKLILALLIYGFVLGYLARMMRVNA